jgi:cell division protein FtsB
MNFKLPSFLKNFYLLTSLVFIIWIFFLDSNDLITQYKRQQNLRNLEKEKLFYEQRKKEIEADRVELEKNQKILEKFAREKYYFKRPKEEVFVIEEQEDNSEKSSKK